MIAEVGTSRSITRTNDLVKLLSKLDAECRNCAPLTPIKCITKCNIWKLKNELRRLRETMEKPNFIKNLFNVLKNETRLYVLNAIVKNRFSVDELQQELRKAGYTHSQEIIDKEYLQPLMNVGLAVEAQEEYYATMFGGKLTDLLEDFPDFPNVLPAHSECYEEKFLSELHTRPKTFQELEALTSPKVASRVLKRLKKAGLMETSKERDYVFFFRSKRDPRKETLCPIEKKVYESIPEEGISAKNISMKIGLSIRRIYRYMRRLKGKKLVFTRKTPKLYYLTIKGEKLASLLRELQDLIEETWNSSEQIICSENS